MDTGIGVNEDAFGGKALGPMTGYGVAVVEMTMLFGVEFDLAVVVEADGQAAIGLDRLDRGHVAIRNAERFVGCGELDTVAYGELAVDFLVDTDPGKAAGIVGSKFTIRFLYCEQVCSRVDSDDRRVSSSSDSDSFAATCVANHVVDLVVVCP